LVEAETRFQLYGTPLRAQRFLALLERLPAAEADAFHLGVIARAVGIDHLDEIDRQASRQHDVATARQVARTMAKRLPRAIDGCCVVCGAKLPPQDRSRGGRPAIYCPGTDCAPSRRPGSRRAAGGGSPAPVRQGS
jgi:hypothetical protein